MSCKSIDSEIMMNDSILITFINDLLAFYLTIFICIILNLNSTEQQIGLDYTNTFHLLFYWQSIWNIENFHFRIFKSKVPSLE